ncbi:MAG: di-trans,poly-cis-decaprenylcistransferase [Helicobacteraceae bacterium]|jgi:undecaprenyl diphosphate synthase|nr:di-trans,poly-cis-decaprenylcistransferase [Helicobacteraceae bacterium]
MKPKHIAIIMDGNGRFAKKLGFADRTEGHKKGAEIVRSITTHCAQIGIEVLTLYAFSTENWKRSKKEVDFLMNIFEKYLKNELETLQKNNIVFNTIGDLTKLNEKLQKKINETIEITKNNNAMTQVLALNYGAKDEIARAAASLASRGARVTENSIESALDTAKYPPVDMLVRTGGEQRLSNFLLWQCAYAELFFTPTLWPEFTPAELDKMIADFSRRNRRFGGE